MTTDILRSWFNHFDSMVHATMACKAIKWVRGEPTGGAKVAVAHITGAKGRPKGSLPGDVSTINGTWWRGLVTDVVLRPHSFKL